MNSKELIEYWKQLKPKPITCMQSFIMGYKQAVREIKEELEKSKNKTKE